MRRTRLFGARSSRCCLVLVRRGRYRQHGRKSLHEQEEKGFVLKQKKNLIIAVRRNRVLFAPDK